MKYFIYWSFYVSNLGGGDISGVVEVTDTTLTSYVYELGYFTWNIIEKDELRSEEINTIEHGLYVLEAPDGLRSVMIIDGKKIEHHIQADTPVRIKMKRK